jgi:lipooligosaccharide transport system permease protein
MFATMSMYVTSFVKVINHFNFYFTGFISPMFFFSGVVFPISQMPRGLQYFAELIPLTHPTRLMRSLCAGRYDWVLLADFLYMLIFIAVVGRLAVQRLKRRMIR